MNMESTTTRKFTGPLFLVGMPRSGTKLLRSLLNEHPDIGIPRVETEFLPYWVRNWNRFGDLSDYSNFKKFYRVMMNLPYFTYMRENGTLIQERVWFNACKNCTPAGIFEALVRHDAKVDFGTNKIWGDKSPSYIGQVPLLKELFPNARFIHIIRDVRDYCLSINKAWGKNMIRAAQRWADSIHEVRMDTNKFPEDYLEVRYENLLDRPEVCLESLCTFLNLKYDSKMLCLSTATENIGDAKGKKEIIKSNKEKYLKLMKWSIRGKIEAIAGPVLRSCGYSYEYRGDILRLSRGLMLFYQALDALNLVKAEMRERSLFSAVAFHLRHFVTSGGRNKK